MNIQQLLSTQLNDKNKSPLTIRIMKRIYQQIGLSGNHSKQLIFIFGCQRSGTTMLERCLERDLRTKLYGQYDLRDKVTDASKLAYADAHGPRLKPYDEIKQIIAKEKASLLIVKPLRESQHAISLLDYFSGSKIIWVYRNYQDVANSNIARWGDGVGIRKLRPIFDGATGDHWAAEHVSEETRAVVKEYFSEDMLPADAGALYWYTRNSLFFELGLDKHPGVFLLRYESFVTEPDWTMGQLYRFLNAPYPGSRLVNHIHQNSVNRGKHIRISPEIEALCDELLQRLDKVYSSQIVSYFSERI
jgi:hypothetical protein